MKYILFIISLSLAVPTEWAQADTAKDIKRGRGFSEELKRAVDESRSVEYKLNLGEIIETELGRLSSRVAEEVRQSRENYKSSDAYKSQESRSIATEGLKMLEKTGRVAGPAYTGILRIATQMPGDAGQETIDKLKNRTLTVVEAREIFNSVIRGEDTKTPQRIKEGEALLNNIKLAVALAPIPFAIPKNSVEELYNTMNTVAYRAAIVRVILDHTSNQLGAVAALATEEDIKTIIITACRDLIKSDDYWRKVDNLRQTVPFFTGGGVSWIEQTTSGVEGILSSTKTFNGPGTNGKLENGHATILQQGCSFTNTAGVKLVCGNGTIYDSGQLAFFNANLNYTARMGRTFSDTLSQAASGTGMEPFVKLVTDYTRILRGKGQVRDAILIEKGTADVLDKGLSSQKRQEVSSLISADATPEKILEGLKND